MALNATRQRSGAPSGRRTVRRALLAACLGLVLAGAAFAATEFARHGDGARHVGEFSPPGRSSMVVHGHVRGLYPGAKRDFRASVRNRTDHDIAIRTLSASVRRTRPGCPAEHLWVGRRRPVDRVVAAHSRIRVHLRAKLRPSAPDGCQGARIGLRFHAKGRAL